ncbi:MAG: orotidine 5'-phosphate decarboxylase / HUMPS family protein [Candidatus Aenigmatarchaeota archaeon]
MGFSSLNHGIIPALDVNTLEEATRIIIEVDDVKGIVGYKAGKILQTNYILKDVLDATSRATNKPVILDPQKEGNDVEFTEPNFIANYANAGVKTMIMFPFSSPRVQATCVKACRNNNVLPIGGFRLTQKGFDETNEVEMGDIDPVFEGMKFRGYISSDAEKRALQVYALMGVEHYIGPGNKIDELTNMKNMLKDYGANPSFLMPGIGRQGGDIYSAFKAVEDCPGAYGIVGSGIHKAKDKVEAAEKLCEEALKFE